MKRILVAVAAISLIATVPAGASALSLSAAGTKLTGRTVTVELGVPPTGTTEALTYVSEGRVILRPRIAKALQAPYAYLSTPWAVAIFAHELGHVATESNDENGASCWARANVYRVARVLGFGPAKAKVITKLARQDSLLYCAH